MMKNKGEGKMGLLLTGAHIDRQKYESEIFRGLARKTNCDVFNCRNNKIEKRMGNNERVEWNLGWTLQFANVI